MGRSAPADPRIGRFRPFRNLPEARHTRPSSLRNGGSPFGRKLAVPSAWRAETNLAVRLLDIPISENPTVLESGTPQLGKKP